MHQTILARLLGAIFTIFPRGRLTPLVEEIRPRHAKPRSRALHSHFSARDFPATAGVAPSRHRSDEIQDQTNACQLGLFISLFKLMLRDSKDRERSMAHHTLV